MQLKQKIYQLNTIRETASWVKKMKPFAICHEHIFCYTPRYMICLDINIYIVKVIYLKKLK